MHTDGVQTPSGSPERTTKQVVLDAAFQNSSLLVKLAETETAPGDLAVHQANISRLGKDIQEQSDVLHQLKDQVDAKYRRHRKYNDNPTLRFLYRAIFNFEKLQTKTAQHEKEYHSALAAQAQAQKRCTLLMNALGSAERVEADLKLRAQEHGDSHARIDELYEALFAGPTPEFPKEDDKENRFYVARGAHERVRQKVITSRYAASKLKVAISQLARADRLLDRALLHARNHVFTFDEAARDLQLTKKNIDYALASVLQASDILQPKSGGIEALEQKVIHDLQQAKPNTKDLSSNREVYTSVIQQSKTQALKSSRQLRSFLALTVDRERTGQDELRKTARKLEDSRQTLQQARMAIFEEVAGFGQAAPSYAECCDRADDFCELPPQPPAFDQAENDYDTDAAPVSPVLPDYEDVTGLGRGGTSDGQRSSVSTLGNGHEDLVNERAPPHAPHPSSHLQ
jgi:hypothetical protein